jgi:alginate production protein
MAASKFIKNSFLISTVILFATTAGFSTEASAAKEVTPGITLDTDLRAQLGDIANGDLNTSGRDNAGTAALMGDFRVTDNFSPEALFLWEGRAVLGAGHGGFESADTGTVSNGKSYLEWRQSYFQFGNVGGVAPAYARLGRQRVAENYGVWWNQDFDAARLTYSTTLFTGSIIGGQNLFSYRTGNNNSEFTNNDKDLARLLAEGSWQYYYDNFIEARMMYQNDHSGLSVGDAENPLNPDDRDGNLVWGGVRAAGKVGAIQGADKISYRADLMTVRGNEDVATIAGNAVAALDRMHVAGWGFDAATDVPLPAACKPSLHLGYAYGSGDGNGADSTDHAFRQTGLQGNFSRFGALSQNTNNYGTVLRPNLSNIHILSAGVTMPVLKGSDFGGIYRFYRLADPAASLDSSGISNNALNGINRQLGQGIDFLFNMDLMKEGVVETKAVQDVALRSSLGFFRSGAAYGASRGETAVRGLVELKVGL